MIILHGRAVRARHPSATCWRVIDHDSATGLPVADIAARWEPAGTTPPGTPTQHTHRWLRELLGPDTRITGPADDIARPGTFHLTSTAHASPPDPDVTE